MKKILLSFCIISIAFSSCTTMKKSTKPMTANLDVTMSDFTLSNQQSASATSVTILGFDFERLFIKKTGSEGGALDIELPIIGKLLAPDPTTSYAMYDLLENNDGADFIFYPQISTKTTCPVIGICLINRITTVEVKAKIGTFK